MKSQGTCPEVPGAYGFGELYLRDISRAPTPRVPGYRVPPLTELTALREPEVSSTELTKQERRGCREHSCPDGRKVGG